MTVFALILGLGLVCGLGLFHQRALLLLDRWTGPDDVHPDRTIAWIFVGLLVIHFLEVLLFAAVYGLCVRADGFGGFVTDTVDWTDLVYFSLINFTTVGYTQLAAVGPLRMIGALESLGGLMVLTWSATFIYSAWQGRSHTQGRKTWDAEARDES